ncbi:hypothetical protein RYZ26_18170 [Terasakiella sp. A23]|uniref:hypothetical protein n=1 Tax=Terasakiella sp. FCG-A23 TaxID=3080561 RepID=UPI002955BE45|nr:hypothetical protein [Terasakiella sp. A23]MDV7341537.1 hypothetical protein [Terasakiella sp. A23]
MSVPDNFFVAVPKRLIYFNMTSLFIGLFTLAAFVAPYFLEIDVSYVGYAGIFFASIVCVCFLFYRKIGLLKQKTLIRIDQDGVFHALKMKKKIPWADIQKIEFLDEIVERHFHQHVEKVHVGHKLAFYSDKYRDPRTENIELNFEAEKLGRFELGVRENYFDIAKAKSVIEQYKTVDDLSTPLPNRRHAPINPNDAR